MRRLERGASYVPLIIVIVLLLVAVVWGYLKQDEADELASQLRAEKEKASKLQKERGEIKSHLVEKVAPSIGYRLPADYEVKHVNLDDLEVDAAKLETELQAAFRTARDEWRVKLPIATFKMPDSDRDFKFDDQDGPAYKPGEDDFRRIEDDQYELTYADSPPDPMNQDIRTYIQFSQEAAARVLADVKSLAEQLRRDRESAMKARAAAQEREKILKENATAKQQALQDEQRNSQATIQGLRREISKLRDDLQKAQSALDREKKERAVQVASLKDDIEDRQQEVVKLKRRKIEIEKPIGPDGSVLAASAGKGIVVLDRGKADHMIPGLVFDVYGFGKGAVKLPKGTVKVLDVGDHTCTARILDLMNDLKPIVPGDKFESVTYNPEEVMHFRLIGRFRKYGKSDAESRLEEIGVAVDKEVTIDTDFLVMGDPEAEDVNLRDTEDYRRAMELGIKVLTEEQLARFLMY